MPTTQQAAGTKDRDQFPEVADEIGEDPARFLDVPLVTPDQIGSSPFELAAARIAGIDDIETARAWLRVESELDRGPRKGVVQRLNRRKAELEADADAPSPEEGDTAAVTAGGDA